MHVFAARPWPILTAVPVRWDDAQADLGAPLDAIERGDKLLLATLETLAEFGLVGEAAAEAGRQERIVRRR